MIAIFNAPVTKAVGWVVPVRTRPSTAPIHLAVLSSMKMNFSSVINPCKIDIISAWLIVPRLSWNVVSSVTKAINFYLQNVLAWMTGKASI